MTFVVKFRGDIERPIVAEYTCPEHGVFSCYVKREANGDAPDSVACPELLPPWEDHGPAGELEDGGVCQRESTWTPSLVACKVKRFEVVRGKWEKPERKTYLDTRELGEGQDIGEFRAKRKAVWEEKRKRDVMEMLK